MIFPGDGASQLHHYRRFPAKAWFEYHCYESEQSSDATLWHHTQQRVEVLRMLTPSEADYEMYLVRFGDGWEAQVFADELMPSRKSFQRKPYIALE